MRVSHGQNPDCSAWGEVRPERGRQSQLRMDFEGSEKAEAIGSRICLLNYRIEKEFCFV